MKKHYSLFTSHLFNVCVILAAFTESTVFAQGNTFPTSGTVGIGTGTSYLIPPTTENAIQFLHSSYGAGYGSKIYSSGDGVGATSFRIAVRGGTTSWTDAFYIRAADGNGGNNGFVGIGTTNPKARLHLLNGLQGAGIAASPTYLRLAYGGPAEQYNGEMSGIVFTKHLDNHEVAKIYTYSQWATNSYNGAELRFATRPSTTDPLADRMVIDQNGNIGIGTTDTKGYKLGVKGSIAAESVKVQVYPWCDYVFYDTYCLRPLSE